MIIEIISKALTYIPAIPALLFTYFPRFALIAIAECIIFYLGYKLTSR